MKTYFFLALSTSYLVLFGATSFAADPALYEQLNDKFENKSQPLRLEQLPKPTDPDFSQWRCADVGPSTQVENYQTSRAVPVAVIQNFQLDGANAGPLLKAAGQEKAFVASVDSSTYTGRADQVQQLIISHQATLNENIIRYAPELVDGWHENSPCTVYLFGRGQDFPNTETKRRTFRTVDGTILIKNVLHLGCGDADVVSFDYCWKQK